MEQFGIIFYELDNDFFIISHQLEKIEESLQIIFKNSFYQEYQEKEKIVIESIDTFNKDLQIRIINVKSKIDKAHSVIEEYYKKSQHFETENNLLIKENDYLIKLNSDQSSQNQAVAENFSILKGEFIKQIQDLQLQIISNKNQYEDSQVITKLSYDKIISEINLKLINEIELNSKYLKNIESLKKELSDIQSRLTEIKKENSTVKSQYKKLSHKNSNDNLKFVVKKLIDMEEFNETSYTERTCTSSNFIKEKINNENRTDKESLLVKRDFFEILSPSYTSKKKNNLFFNQHEQSLDNKEIYNGIQISLESIFDEEQLFEDKRFDKLDEIKISKKVPIFKIPISDEENKKIKDDPYKDFFMLTYMSFKINNPDFNYSEIYPERLFLIAKKIHTPFHKFNFYLQQFYNYIENKEKSKERFDVNISKTISTINNKILGKEQKSSPLKNKKDGAFYDEFKQNYLNFKIKDKEIKPKDKFANSINKTKNYISNLFSI